ncbi:hypothetical protein AGMMS49960_20510 [Betaproteobacteria bacterium]|nr:hypothetical protein AGMMS49960_20510 [Betaproteobacteria bacterium]
MFAVKGFYDGNAVQLNTAALPTKEKYSVVVTFLHPAQQPEAEVSEAATLSPANTDEAVAQKRRDAFDELKALAMALKQPVPPDFDYKKELAEYRDERYGYLS